MLRAAWSVLLALLAAGCAPADAEPVVAAPLSFGKILTFLFLTLGPGNVAWLFVAKTRGFDKQVKRRIAIEATLYAGLAVLAAATVGVATLNKWGVSVTALQFSTGLLLFLVALRQVLALYGSRDSHADAPPRTDAGEAPNPATLAFSLAFPAIATPYGIALVIMILTVRAGTAYVLPVLLATGVVLVVDLAVMLVAERIVTRPTVVKAAAIVGVIMAVLMLSLGVQAGFEALRVLLDGGATTTARG